jgi:hypothetical protein
MAGFLPRPELMARVRELIAKGRVALSGQAGVGKTRLAVEYAHQFAGGYELVWWLNAERVEDVGDQLGQLAVRVGAVGAQADTATRLAAAKAYLRGLEASRWLVIFDNVEDHRTIRDLIPDGNGHTLLTSRNPNWIETAAAVPIDVFTRAESLRVLRHWLPDLTEAEADSIAHRLGDLPLALAQAAGLIAEEHLTADQYLARLPVDTSSNADLFYSGSFAAAIALSMKRLRAIDPRAEHLMRQCAMLAPEVVPLSIVDPSGADLRQSVALLSRLGLCRPHPDGLQVHRLTVATIGAALTDSERADLRGELSRRLAYASPHETDDATAWPEWRRLLPHLLALDPATTETESLRGMACRAVRHLLVRGDIHAGLDLARNVYTAWRDRFGPDDAHTLRMGTRLAMAQFMTGDVGRARQLREETLRRQRQALGPDHPDTLQTAQTHYLDLVMVHPAQARDLLLDTLARQRRVLGDDHTETFQSTRFLAVSLHLLGQTADAAMLTEESLPRQRQSLGDTHPFTLQTASDLADYWAELGRLEPAAALAEETLARQRVAFGDTNRDALGTAAALAKVLFRQGDHAAAAQLARDTIARAETLPDAGVGGLHALVAGLRLLLPPSQQPGQ